MGKSNAATPAADNFFQVRNKEADPISQLLFVSTIAHRDIQTAVAFLSTMVKSPDEDDWGKFKSSKIS